MFGGREHISFKAVVQATRETRNGETLSLTVPYTSPAGLQRRHWVLCEGHSLSEAAQSRTPFSDTHQTVLMLLLAVRLYPSCH